MTLNINQFAQGQVRGALDLQINPGPVLSGQISQNEAGAPKAGDKVKLDEATVGATPQFLLATKSETGIGRIVYDVKNATLAKGDACAVALDGTVMVLIAASTIVPQANVEDLDAGTVQTLAAESQSGVALDPGVAGKPFRVIIKNVKKA